MHPTIVSILKQRKRYYGSMWMPGDVTWTAAAAKEEEKREHDGDEHRAAHELSSPQEA